MRKDEQEKIDVAFNAIFERLEKLDRKIETNGSSESFFKTTAHWIWKQRLAIAAFTFGFVAGGLIVPFVSVRAITPFSAPIHSPIVTKTTLELIVDRAPKDQSQRRELARAYGNTASEIQKAMFKDTETALAFLRTETGPILLMKEWNTTASELAGLTDRIRSLDELADKLNEIKTEFEK